MHSVFHVFPSLVFLLATASRATAGVPLKLNHKRQDTATLKPLHLLDGALSTVPSSITGPLATQVPQVSPLVQDQAAAGTTTGGSPTATSGSSDRGDIIVAVEKPSLCSESAFQFSSSYSLPTGTILIQTESGGDGWGEEGSIWNITTSDAVELQDLKVPCAGSACTGINGNKREDGMIAQNPDKSWSLNVTADMLPSVKITGQTSGNPVGGKYDLTITSTPVCGLPIFQNCSERKFDPSDDQWAAYSAGDFLTKYLAEKNINSLSSLLAEASSDFLPTTDAANLICNPDAGTLYTCNFPSYTQCDSSSADTTAGYLVVASAVRMSQMLQLLYNTIQNAQNDMAGYITQIVVKFFSPILTQEWQALVAAVSSIVGLFTFAAILLDALTAAALTGVLVAAVVGVQSALAAAANFQNGFTKEKPDATYLAIDGNYTQGVMDYCRGLQEVIDNTWNSTELGSGGIAEALGSGAWLSVPNPFNVTGIYEDARDWIDNLLVTSYINKAMKDNDAYIIFLPYGNISYYGTIERHNFTQDECANHWANDPSWPYFATCDISLGAGGKEGMAVVVRPRASGWGSRSWTSEVEWQWAGYTWDAHAMMQSSLYGYAEHGYDYNLTSVNFQDLLSKGSQEAKEQWKTMPLSTPGLFNLAVCEIPSLAFVTGGEQVQLDMGSNKGWHFPNPWSCQYANKTSAGGLQMFVDHVSPKVRKSIELPLPDGVYD